MLSYSQLQEISRQVGIDKVGVSVATELEADRLNDWLNQGYHGQMSYMERNKEKRLDPSKLLKGARSVISVFVNYHQDENNSEIEGIISKYAQSTDYHPVIKDLLHDLARGLFGSSVMALSRKQRVKVYRIFVDSAPVMEKELAVAAGIGWRGKHSNIITREYGSWGFLGEIITTEEFDQYDLPVPDLCGSCTACIDACPTHAIVEPYRVDGSRCISYATIELSHDQPIAPDLRSKMGDWLFGCDICQDVCPWNRFETQSSHPSFIPVESLRSGGIDDFHDLEEQVFIERYGTTPLRRPGLMGMRRNQTN